MVTSCPRCKRANPREAAYCYFDGHFLKPVDKASNHQGFSREFVFPSGRRCRSYEELLEGIYYEWDDAKDLLKSGAFGQFLSAQGRADLARSSQEFQQQSDPDIGLTNFTGLLPASGVKGPRLGLNPRRLIIGPMRVGEKQTVSIRITNEGRGILQGRVRLADGDPWLAVVLERPGTSFAVHCPREQTLTLQVNTSGLVVGQNHGAKLLLVTNGGVAEIPVRLELVGLPFPHAPYQGARTPQELARQMRDNPHAAAALFHSGDIARWFETNGWSYPILGAPAPGLAAVQQYFEELGLARAPQLTVSNSEFHFHCEPREVIESRVLIQSPARKLVYGWAESNAPWLKILTPDVYGQGQTAIAFSVDSSRMPEDRLYEGNIRIIANAGQTFQVRVRADVLGNKKGNPLSSPREQSLLSAEVLDAPIAKTGDAEGNGFRPPVWNTSLPLAPASVQPSAPVEWSTRQLMVWSILGCLFLRLLFVIPGDLLPRLFFPGGQQSPTPGTLTSWSAVPSPEGSIIRWVSLALCWFLPLLALRSVRQRNGPPSDQVFALVAGCFGGLAFAATLCCVVVAGDSLPRFLLGLVPLGSQASPWIATPLWLLIALLAWMLIGACVGALLVLIRPLGRSLLSR
ncbi:MAG: DUF5717 family protein [Gemmataceae bacterium]